MTQTNGASGGNTPWKGDQAPCVYCGQNISRQIDRCPHCRTSFSLAVRKASREIIGPWYYLDLRNPSGRGVTFETLIKMIEKGRIRADSVVRGPTTHQDWMYAAETPRLAKYLGMCPHCFAEAKPEDVYCTRCQLNMNQRPAEPRPGIPADLVKEPVHKASYEMEKELVRATAASEEAFSSETFEGPKPAPAPLAAPRPEVPSAPVSSVPSAVAAAAVTAMADAGAAVDRQSRIAAARRRKPKVWIVLILTWVTLLPLLGVGFLVDFAGMRAGLMRLVRSGDGGTPEGGTGGPMTDEGWLNAQLAEVDKAEQSHDYDAAVTILRTIIDKTGDPKWRPTLESRIVGIRKKAADERKMRLTKLTDKLNVARKMAEEGEYESALDILRNIPADDRAFLAALTSPSGDSIAVNVAKMEAKIRDDQARYTLQKKQEEQLTALVLKANDLVTAKQWPQALETYKQIGAFPPAMLLKREIDVDKTLKAIQSHIAAAPTPTPPTPTPPTPTPPTPPTPTPPAPRPTQPATGTPEELTAAAKALMDEALALDKAEQFEPEVAKLEEIKAKFEDKYWPPGLEDRIKQVKAKIEALKFFGMDGPKKGEKPPKTPPKTP